MTDYLEDAGEMDAIAQDALSLADERGWPRSWQEIGAYIHQEASEYVSALRRWQQGDAGARANMREEAGDILLVLLSSLANERMEIGHILFALADKIDQLRKEGK